MKQSKLKNGRKPKRFQNNLIVIGGGSAGLVTAYIAAALKAKVTLIEKDKMGGDCLNHGCVPSKALISAARLVAGFNKAKALGIKRVDYEFEFADVMQHVHDAIKQIEPHDSVARYRQLGVNVIEGEAEILSPWEVQVKHDQGAELLTTRSIVIATGAKPLLPPIPGLDAMQALTSENIWQLKTLPKRLLVLGGGPIGCELSQCFQRLGSEVALLEMAPRLLMREDEEVSELVVEMLAAEGVDIRLQHKAMAFSLDKGQKTVTAESPEGQISIVFDEVLVALGRKPNVNGFGVEKMDIQLAQNQAIQTNPFQQTNYPNIFACGDVCSPFQFTHVAAHQAWYAAVNALFGGALRLKTDYSVVPWCTFLEPEIARVGLNEQDAKAQGVAYEVTRFDLDALDRAIVERQSAGFVKVLSKPGGDKILGVTLVGEHAGDLIAEFVLAMKYGLGLNKILRTMHIYPTRTEANKSVAGVWRNKHSGKMLLALIERYHGWRRNE